MAQVEVRIPYGRGCQVARVEEDLLCGILTPPPMPRGEESEEQLVQRALCRPVAGERLCVLASKARRVLLITSDHTRPVPSRITLALLLREIRKGNPAADITILIATGMHRATTKEEMRRKFGEQIASRERIVVHDAFDREHMADFGLLPSGGRLRVNALACQADLIVAEGFIEPHFFAGFSGGRKSILPGIASEETIRYNHNAGFIASPRARQGVLCGNPINEDMAFAARKVGLRFILNVVLDEDKRILGAFAGEPEQAHRQGCAYCAAHMSVPAVQADIVVTSNGGYPLDQNVYQCVKGMTAAEACAAPGGTIILCAALGDGSGGEAFCRYLAREGGPQQVLREIERTPPERTQPDQWQAQILARIMSRFEVYFVCGARDRALVEAMHMRWAPDVNAALQQAILRRGGRARVAVIPDGVGVIVRPRG